MPVSLIRGAIFRPSIPFNLPGSPLLQKFPLAELLDRYHAHQATRPHDKVYALLGMCSDDLSSSGLLPNYSLSWEDIARQVYKAMFGKHISYTNPSNWRSAELRGRGHIIGAIISLKGMSADVEAQVRVIDCPGIPADPKFPWILHASAKQVQLGDLVCILDGFSALTIVRMCDNYLNVIVVAANPPEEICWQLSYEAPKQAWSSLLRVLLENTTMHNFFFLMWSWTELSESVGVQPDRTIDRVLDLWDISCILMDTPFLYRERRKKKRRDRLNNKLHKLVEICNGATTEERVRALASLNQRALSLLTNNLHRHIGGRMYVELGGAHYESQSEGMESLFLWECFGEDASFLNVLLSGVFNSSHLDNISFDSKLKAKIRFCIFTERMEGRNFAKWLLADVVRDNDPDFMYFLLEREGVLVSEEMLLLATRNQNNLCTLKLLLERGGREARVTEAVLKSAASLGTFGPIALELLFEHRRRNNGPITAPVAVPSRTDRTMDGKKPTWRSLEEQGLLSPEEAELLIRVRYRGYTDDEMERTKYEAFRQADNGPSSLQVLCNEEMDRVRMGFGLKRP